MILQINTNEFNLDCPTDHFEVGNGICDPEGHTQACGFAEYEECTCKSSKMRSHPM